MTRIGRTRRIVLFWTAAALIAALEAVLTAGWLVGKTSARIYSSVNDIPARKVGIVLGCPEYSNGRPSPVLAAQCLFHDFRADPVSADHGDRLMHVRSLPSKKPAVRPAG